MSEQDPPISPLDQIIKDARVCLQAGNLISAEKNLTQAKELAPGNPNVSFLAGQLEYAKSDYKSAIEIFDQLLARFPDFVDVHVSMASSYNAMAQLDKAEMHYRRAVELQPNNYIFHNILGSFLKSLKQYTEAEKHFNAAIALSSDYWPPYYNLGDIFSLSGSYQKAAECFEKALKYNPDPIIHSSLISVASLFNPEQGYQYAAEFIRSGNKNLALLTAFVQCIQAADWQLANEVTDDIVELIMKQAVPPISTHCVLMPLNKPWGLDRKVLFELHRLWGEQIMREIDPYTDFEAAYAPCNHVRIGYVSGDFREHSVGHFIENIVASHDKKRFSVYCYSNTDQEDDLTSRIRNHCSKFEKIRNLTDENLANKIHSDGIHILVDLSGQTGSTRLQAFKYSPAPVQITYLGYPNTTGLEAMDYRITDIFADHEEGTIYTEKLLKMPESFLCFGSFRDRPAEPILAAEKNGFITFGSFNSITKINDRVIRSWCQILRAVENSRLIIKSANLERDYIQKNIVKEFAKYGIDQSRVAMMGFKTSKEDHLDLYNKIDIALDPYPYNGTTTTCESLWMGVPVITLVGKLHAQRVSYSILKNIRVEDTITFSEAEYVQVAVSLAGNLKKLRNLREKIHSSIRGSILCDPLRFTRQLEGLYLEAWEAKIGRNLEILP